MNQFISNIISRHMDAADNIHPRLPGIFENVAAMQSFHGQPGFADEPFANAGENVFSTLHEPTQGIEQKHSNDHTRHTLQHQYSESTGFDDNASNHFNPGSKISPQPANPIISNNSTGFSVSPASLTVSDIHQPLWDKGITRNTTTDIQSENSNTENHPHENKSALQHSQGELNGIDNSRLTNQNNPVHLIVPSIPHPSTAKNNFLQPALNLHETTAIIKISIGRIEVKAVTAPQPTKSERNTPVRPKMSLEEYLKNRNNTEQ